MRFIKKSVNALGQSPKNKSYSLFFIGFIEFLFDCKRRGADLEHV